MSTRFALFLFLIWNPLMLVGGSALGDAYRDQFNALSVVTQAGVVYLFMLLSFAPLIWKAFFRNGK